MSLNEIYIFILFIYLFKSVKSQLRGYTLATIICPHHSRKEPFKSQLRGDTLTRTICPQPVGTSQEPAQGSYPGHHCLSTAGRNQSRATSGGHTLTSNICPQPAQGSYPDKNFRPQPEGVCQESAQG